MPLRLPTLELPIDLVEQLTELSTRDGAPAFAYARISQDREGAGLGIDRQLAELMPLFARHNLRLAGVFADNDFSAYSGKPRPDYLALLAALAAGGALAVTCWHTDRLHRSVRELLDYIVLSEQRRLLTYGWRAGELDLSTPTGRAMAITQTAWARHESEHKADRIRAARLQAAQQGHRQGGKRPFGFESDGETIRQAEADEIVKATEAILAGASLRGVVRDLNAAGLKTTFGKDEWSPGAFKDVLLRPRNAGLMVYHGEVIGPAAWPAIVPEDTWRALCAVLTDPSRRTSPGPRGRWLGSNLYVCSVCELPDLRVSTAGGKRNPAYRCKARDKGYETGHVTRDAVVLDDFVERLIVARLSRPDAADLLISPAEAVDTTSLHTEATATRELLNQLDDDLDSDLITRDRWLRRNKKLLGRLDEIQVEITNAAMVDPLAGIVGAPDVRKLWFGTKPDRSDGLDLGRRRAVLDALCTVTVLKAGHGRRPDGTYFDPEAIKIDPKRV
jgi:DNA invertase Pin-like site-specific DNA recombinase